jgi:hypothetical protein
VIGANGGRIQGLLVKIKGIVVGGGQVFGGGRGFAPTDLSDWYKGTLSDWLPRTILQLA